MKAYRENEPAAPHHLIEPINPDTVSRATVTPGVIARLLDDDLYHRRIPLPNNPTRTIPPISTDHSRIRNNSFDAPPISPMDTLANTALSTSPIGWSNMGSRDGPSQATPFSLRGDYHHVDNRMEAMRGQAWGQFAEPEGRPVPYGQRPPKRARSEALRSPEQNQTESRPATSHNPSIGVSYNVEQGINNGFRMRHPSQSELEIGEFLSTLASQRRTWSQSHATIGADEPHETVLQAGAQPHSLTMTTPSSSRHDLPATSEANFASLDHFQSHNQATLQDESSVLTAQTHTPPEDNPVPLDIDTTNEDTQDGNSKHKYLPSKNQTSDGMAQSKASEKQKAHTSLEAPQQLESPRSLLVDDTETALETVEVDTHKPVLLHRRSSVPDMPSHLRVTDDAIRPSSMPPNRTANLGSSSSGVDTPKRKKARNEEATVCAHCNYSANAVSGEEEFWLQCDGCKGWFHFTCAGFSNIRQTRSIDKFFCKKCQPAFGKSTRVRKSERAHTSVDYKKLQEGQVQTADDTPEHHWIGPIKNGEFKVLPENFARMAPELVTAEYFEKCKAMTEPVVIPAHLNPRPNLAGSEGDLVNAGLDADDGQERTLDVGQDKLGMVIPQGLTVRKVAELVGEDTKLPVIDVKTQQSADWKLSQWVDYYENEDENKSIRNVISLEVSKTKLGRLIRRPDVVRDLDLADAVWPNDGVGPPPVQFYVLMSAEDCYTDFHIDFGGSSVYYHILKGQKTFFFIPPKPSHLKRYEEWNMSPSQNHTWLGHVTKECYRVDLSEGDTMLIPSGWIHSVWTPKNSLVIGGNFLTRLSYPNQIRITEIEKTTGVPKKFKYPHFQKIMWLQVLQYLERDPVPAYVEALLIEGKQFPREVPLYREYNKFGHNSDPGPENYNARYYPQAELDGLPRLVAYIFRTVMIALGRMDNIPLSTIAAVEKSIPTKLDYAADNARRFALWVAWKRGNETIPDWAYPDIELPNYNKKALGGEKQLSAAASKRQERQAALDLHHAMNADIRTARQRSSRVGPSNPESRSGSPSAYNPNHYASPKNSVLGPKRSACDACRKRRVACKHKDEVTNAFMVNGQRQYEFVAPSAASASSPAASASNGRMLVAVEVPSRYEPSDAGDFDSVAVVTPDRPVASSINVTTSTSSANNSGGPRNRACANCRKSKRKCLHDENGNLDQAKVLESQKPRVSSKKRQAGAMEGEQEAKRAKKEAPSAVPEDAVIHVNGVSTAEKQQYLAAADAADTVQDPFVDAADVKPPVEPSAVVDGIIEEAVLAQSEVDAMDVDGVGNARVDPEVVGVVAPVEEAMDLDEIPQQDGVELAPLVGSVEETPQQIAHEALIAVTPKKSAPPIPTSPLSEMVAPSSPTVATPPRSRSRRASSTKGDIQVKRETPGGDSMEPEEEDASMKLAKLLQGEEFGLRRRSR